MLREPQRLAALAESGLEPDRPVQGVDALDRLAALVAKLFNVPFATVTLVDDERQAFPGMYCTLPVSLDLRETPVSHSICRYVATTGAPVVIPDASQDERVSGLPAVRDLGVSAYVGVPLTTADGHVLGSLCAVDTVPRAWTDADVDTLRTLANFALTELEVRRTENRAQVAERSRAAKAQSDRDRLVEAFRRSPSFITILRGPELVYEFVNDGYCRLVGRPAPAILDRPIREVLHEVAGQGFFELLDQVYATGEPCSGSDVSVLLLSEPGQPPKEHFVDFIFQATRAPDGTVDGVFVHGVDWTERKLAQKGLADVAEQRRMALDAAQMGWWQLDLASKQVFCDERFKAIFGTDREVVSYDWIFTIIHPDDRERIDTSVQAAVRPVDPVPYAVECRLVREDGSLRWATAKGQAIFAGEGPDRRAVSLVGTVTDVTEARETREALSLSEQRHRLAIDGAQLGTFSWELPSRRVHWNARMKELFFLPPDAEMSLDVGTARLHPDDREPARQAVEAALAGRTSYQIEYRAVNPVDGQVRWLHATGRAFADAVTGELTQVHGVTVDMTAKKLAQQQASAAAQRERAILESITDSFFAFDADWRFTYLNVAARQGMAPHVEDPAALLGQNFFEVFPYNRGTPIEQAGRRAMAEGVMAEFEMIYEPWDRSYYGRCFPIQGGGLAIYFRDTTQEKQAAETVRANEAKYRSFFDSIDTGFCVLEMVWDDRGNAIDYRYLEMNPAFVAHSGMHDAIGKTMREIYPGFEQKFIDRYARVVQTGEAIRFEEGSEIMGRWFEVYAFALHQGNQDHVAVLFSDISERRRGELALQAAKNEAERNSQMKDEFLATLSHELRTPLNAILGWTQVLRGDPANTADMEAGLATIERNSRAQTQIIEDLLDMSKIISGKVRLDVQPLQLDQIIAAAVETMRPAAAAKDIRLQALIDPEARMISGDPNRLQQVFWNLLSNAIKFTPKGGKVQVVLERVNSHLEVSIADTGEGIAPEFLPFVFDRFRQQDASTTRRHGGLGLGLAIVKQLVELHGGSIRVESAGPGQGATFKVLLPLSVVQPAPDPTDVERRHPRSGGASLPRPVEGLNLAGVKVLVVDDEADARALVQRLLEDRGAAVQSVGSVAEAVARIRASPPDVLVSDIGMPEEDGFALIRQVRALPAEQGGNTPAVALTAYARSEDRLKVILAGFQTHMAKPVEAVELLALVASLAGRVATPRA